MKLTKLAAPDKIGILLASGHSLFREVTRVALEKEADIEVVAEVGDGLVAVAEAERVRPDVAILEATLPGCGGVEATARIKERVAECRVLILEGQESQSIFVGALEAGASGFVTKDQPLVELMNVIRVVHKGGTLIPPQMLETLLTILLGRRKKVDDAHLRLSRLTRREREVLVLLAEGAGNEAIAKILVISPQTARTHIQNLMSKLGVHSRLQAAAFVTQNKLLQELAKAE